VWLVRRRSVATGDDVETTGAAQLAACE